MPLGAGRVFTALATALGWIVAARVKRMAFQQSLERAKASTDRSIASDDLDRVLAAGGRETATGARQRADRVLVKTNQSNQEPTGGSP